MEQTTLFASPKADGFRDEKMGAQLVKWGKMRWDTLQPTNVDALIEWRNRGYTIIEAKREGAYRPQGQDLAFRRMTDDLRRAKKNTIYIVATHTTPSDKSIYLDNALVESCYPAGAIKHPENMTTYEICDYFQREELKLNL